MPNWVDTNWNVTLPTKNVKRFLNYFLSSNDTDKLRGRFLYRTFIADDSINIVETSPGISHVAFFSNSAWSLESILVERGPDEKGFDRCSCLDWVCKDCEVIDLKARGDELMMGFREFIKWDPDNGLSHESEDVTIWCCDECNAMGYWEDDFQYYPESVPGKKFTMPDIRIVTLTIFNKDYVEHYLNKTYNSYKLSDNIGVDAGLCGFYSHLPESLSDEKWNNIVDSLKSNDNNNICDCTQLNGVTVSSGFGDGVYKVYKLTVDRKVVGLQLVFA